MVQKRFSFNEFSPSPRKGTSAFLPGWACSHGRPKGAVGEYRICEKVGGASPRSGRKMKAHGASRGEQAVKRMKPAKRAKESGPGRWVSVGSAEGRHRVRSVPRTTLLATEKSPLRTWTFRPLRGLTERSQPIPTAYAMGFTLPPASRADRALATDTHGLRHGLSSFARFAGSPRPNFSARFAGCPRPNFSARFAG